MLSSCPASALPTGPTFWTTYPPNPRPERTPHPDRSPPLLCFLLAPPERHLLDPHLSPSCRSPSAPSLARSLLPPFALSLTQRTPCPIPSSLLSTRDGPADARLRSSVPVIVGFFVAPPASPSLLQAAPPPFCSASSSSPHRPRTGVASSAHRSCAMPPSSRGTTPPSSVRPPALVPYISPRDHCRRESLGPATPRLAHHLFLCRSPGLTGAPRGAGRCLPFPFAGVPSRARCLRPRQTAAVFHCQTARDLHHASLAAVVPPCSVQPLLTPPSRAPLVVTTRPEAFFWCCFVLDVSAFLTSVRQHGDASSTYTFVFGIATSPSTSKPDA